MADTLASGSSEKKPSHYAGIGASAGGLEAIETFFQTMPQQHHRLAFIVVQHLSPDYKSLMVELLSKKTAMPVLRAEDGLTVEAGKVYLIPPRKNLTIFHGKLLLKDKDQSEGINLPIDIFLQSLAEDQGEKAIAIILSGTGSDGARGVRAVKEHNGMVMVQEETSAKFNGMPRAAISTGAADFILTPEKMPRQLLAYVAHPYISGEKKADSLLNDRDALTRLFAELRSLTRVDFTYYKPSTITRRIERRMSINQITDFEEYVQYLQHSSTEVMALHRELLIGVTSFFRDKETMRELQTNVLPDLCRKAAGRELRCWVAGCSSGEEAYTLAIMFKETMEELGSSQDIKIFATDVDRDAIMRASTGTYPESIAADIDRRILGKYFYHRDDSYQIARHVREMVVFAQHNLVKDPPFTNIDLISCRNLLIYLQQVLQVHALEAFNFSLNAGGILFLGNSETIGDLTEYFKPIHLRFRIYQSRGRTIPLRSSREMGKVPRKRIMPGSDFTGPRPFKQDIERDTGILRPYLESLAKHYFRLSIIVNEQMEVEHIIGNSEGFLSIPSGPPEYSINKLAGKDLAIPLSTGIQKALRTGEAITFKNVHLQHRPQNTLLLIRVVPLPKQKGQERRAAVFLEERQSPASPDERIPSYDINEEAQQRIEDLEQELQFARENLQATIEELETSNEELQATNEELMASNEELQSTNEELQSTNEELYTVNAEHQSKIIELTELSNDVDNLLTSSGIGTLIVDENLEIRKFSPKIANIFNIIDKDVGRPFSHISHFLKEFDPVEAVKKVQKSEKTLECDVETRDGRWYLARIIPYAIGPKTFSGTVLTFVDISEVRTAKIERHLSDRTSSDISANIPIGLFVYRLGENGSLLLESSNLEAQRLTGISRAKVHDMPFEQIWPSAEKHGLLDRFKAVLASGEPCIIPELRYRDENLEGVYRVHAFRLPQHRLAVSFQDLTRIDRTTRQLQESKDNYRQLFANIPVGVVYQNSKGYIIDANPAAEKILGLSLAEMRNLTSDNQCWQAISVSGAPLPGPDHPSMIALQTGKPVIDFPMGIYSGNDETTRWLKVSATPLFQEGESQPYQVFTIFEDIPRETIAVMAQKSSR